MRRFAPTSPREGASPVASGFRHKEFDGNEESLQGEVTDRRFIDEEACGGGGSDDAADRGGTRWSL